MLSVSAGTEAEEFFKCLKCSQIFLLSTLSRRLDKDFEGDNYYKIVKKLTGDPFYKEDNKSKTGFKLDKKVYKIIKRLIEKEGARLSYF